MDIFRQEYRQLSDEDKKHIAGIKDQASVLYALLSVPAAQGSREMALAKTKLEECVMWATKGLT